MKKLVRGIVEFREERRESVRGTFAQLALGQKPDALFIACSDSRVAANVFASTDPGDLFVVRNVGNLIPPCGPDGRAAGDESEIAAIEFALLTLPVTSLVVCGHSSCGAMLAIHGGRDRVASPHLRSWLRHAEPSLARPAPRLDPALPDVDRLSQRNVLQQLDHLRTYPLVRDREQSGSLGLYALWFDIQHAEVSWYEPERERFVPIDRAEGHKILRSLERGPLPPGAA